MIISIILKQIISILTTMIINVINNHEKIARKRILRKQRVRKKIVKIKIKNVIIMLITMKIITMKITINHNYNYNHNHIHNHKRNHRNLNPNGQITHVNIAVKYLLVQPMIKNIIVKDMKQMFMKIKNFTNVGGQIVIKNSEINMI